SAGHLAGAGADPDRRHPLGNNHWSAAGAPPGGASQRRAGSHPGNAEAGAAGAFEPRSPFVVKTWACSGEIFREIQLVLFSTAQLRLTRRIRDERLDPPLALRSNLGLAWSADAIVVRSVLVRSRLTLPSRITGDG